MGNVNTREDGSSSPSGVEEGESNTSVQEEGMSAPDGLMGQSPPHSPRATHSPLMFTPQKSKACQTKYVATIPTVTQDPYLKTKIRELIQASNMTVCSTPVPTGQRHVPVAPLQRPDEMHIPTHSWMQNTSRYEDVSNEIGIPTMITWSYDGQEVAVEGSWDNWNMRIPLQRSGKDFTIMKVLPSGVYQYRFLVDGQWRYAPDLPCAQDDVGNTYNILDLQDYVPEDLESISSFEPPQSPELSYNNFQLTSEDFAKEPPLVPPHMQMTLLNVPASHMEIPPPLSRPQHVVLNHLYMQKGKSGPSVVALGSTHRFLAKYVTVVLYKSMQR